MHFNSGYFHGDICVENSYKIKELEYNAIQCVRYDNNTALEYGNTTISSLYTGKDILINSRDNITLTAINDINLYSTVKVNKESYGYSLPDTGKTGQVFFKLIN